ncbi:MAG: hypothetical protein RSH25_12950 [Bacteroides sp.]|uniref:hypothetical protein n=1 Tax=Bacteroides sp. TaxID=29523 RepID=UPI002FCB71CF
MTHEDIVLGTIFEEMKQADVNRRYAELFIDKHLKRNKRFDALITCFSIGGAGLGLINLVFPASVTFVICIAQIIKHIFPTIMRSPGDISKASTIAVEYDKYFLKIKKIHDDLFASFIDSRKAEKEFRNIVAANAANKNELSRIFGKTDNKMNTEAANRSDDHLNSIYNEQKQ